MSFLVSQCFSRGFCVQKFSRVWAVCQYRNVNRSASHVRPEGRQFLWSAPLPPTSVNISRLIHTSPKSSGQQQNNRQSSDESSSSGSDNDDDEERRKANQKLFLIGLVSVPILYNLVYFLVNKVAMAGSPEERQAKELRYKQKDDAIFGTNTANGGPNFVQQMNQPSPEYNLNRLSPDPAVRAQQRQEVSWNDFYYQMLLAGEVQEIVIHTGLPLATVILRPDAVYKGRKVTNNEFKLKLQTANDSDRRGGQLTDKTLEDKIRAIEAKIGIPPGSGVSITYTRRAEGIAQGLSAVISVGIMVGIFFMFRKLGSSLSNTMTGSINKMTKADFTLIDPKNRGAHTKSRGVKFSDVAGLKEPKVEVMEFVDYLKNPAKYATLGAKPPKGALLTGPPGCGKTMLAKAIANEAGVPFLSMNGSEFIEMIGGLGAARVRSLFAEARKRSPSIIYIDEIDAIGRKRSGVGGGAGGGGGGGSSGGEAEQTLNQLLVEMDGIVSSTEGNVIMIASTNRADVLDKALLRPGRFDRHIAIDLPTVIERKEILEQHMTGVKLADSRDTFSERLATLTPGFSGADLANLVNEAALHAARLKKKKVFSEDLEYAIERVIAGPEKKTGMLNQAERRIVAYHESGHAIVGWMLEHTDALLKVTILPRTSQALGFAQYTPVDKKLYSPEEMMDRMCMALGGRVAESLTFNRITTGAQNDLQKVTQMANAQIKQFGFNDVVGLVSFEEGGGKKPYSKRLHATMDHEARQLISEAYIRTEQVLKEHRKSLELMAEALLEKETLNYDDVEALLGPPPHGKKHLVSPVDYENQLKQQGNLGKETQSI